MSRRLKRVAVALIVVFAAAQLIRPGRANPPIDAQRTIQAHVATGSTLPAILDRACRDCHSNATVWPWYTQVAPLSWLMAYAVRQGRQVVNFSEWTAYAPAQQARLLAATCHAVTEGQMPGGAWTLLHPEARLSAQEIETICAAARP